MFSSKKFFSLISVFCFASALIFAQQDNVQLKELAEKIVARENSGDLVSTGGTGLASSDGGYVYISDGKNVYLVDDSGNFPYEYTKISAKLSDASGFVFVVYAKGKSEDDSFYFSEKKRLLSQTQSQDFFSQFSDGSVDLELLYQELSSYTIDYSEKVKIGDDEYILICTDLNNDKNYEGLELIEDSQSPIEKSSAGEDLLKYVVGLFESGALVDTNGHGKQQDGYSYYSNGKNVVVAEVSGDWNYTCTFIKSDKENLNDFMLITYSDEPDEAYKIAADGLLEDNHEYFKTLDELDVAEAKNILEIPQDVASESLTVKMNGKYCDVVLCKYNSANVAENQEAAKQSEPPTQSQLEALFNHILEIEKSGELTGAFGGNGNYSYIRSGDKFYLVEDSFDIPYEYSKIRSDEEDVPNLIFVTYGYSDDWNRYYFANSKKSLDSQGEVEFNDVDLKQAYETIKNKYTITFATTAEIDGEEYEVLFSDINDDQNNDIYGADENTSTDLGDDYFEDYEEKEIPPLDENGLESLLDGLVERMNKRGYPSLMKSDKPYVIYEQEGVYILRTDGYTSHVDVSGDYLYCAQLYTADFEQGAMVFGFAKATMYNFFYMNMTGSSSVDEEKVMEAHKLGNLIVTQYDIDEFLSDIEDFSVFEKDVVVDGVNYHVYCVPMDVE